MAALPLFIALGMGAAGWGQWGHAHGPFAAAATLPQLQEPSGALFPTPSRSQSGPGSAQHRLSHNHDVVVGTRFLQPGLGAMWAGTAFGDHSGGSGPFSVLAGLARAGGWLGLGLARIPVGM